MAEILKVEPHSPQPERIARAVELIRQGQVVAIPTDTLYGLAADPFQIAAVERVMEVKGRAPDAPIPLLVDSLSMAEGQSKNLPASFRRLAERYWPGPLTIVVEASERVPALITSNTGQVGLRLPAAVVPRSLVGALGGPITGTSANRSGTPPCRSAIDVETSLGAELPLILDGGPSLQVVPSTVIRVMNASWELIREGAIGQAELELFFQSLKSDV